VSKQDLRGQTLYGIDLRTVNLLNADITINCASFHGAKLSSHQVGLFLKMFALADIDARWKDGLHRLVEDVLGPNKAQALSALIRVV
jgi:hypothetical protein